MVTFNRKNFLKGLVSLRSSLIIKMCLSTNGEVGCNKVAWLYCKLVDKIQEVRFLKGKSKISFKEKMRSRFKEKFLPPNFTQTIFSQLNNLCQNTKNVFDYTEEFYKLLARNDTQEMVEKLLARYVGGLKFSIRDEVEMHRLWRMHGAYQLSLKVEAKLV